jgi:hypothetical protein
MRLPPQRAARLDIVRIIGEQQNMLLQPRHFSMP